MVTREISFDEELHIRPPHRKVFISSEMRSGVLTEARRAVAESIEGPELGRGWYHAWYWERDAIAGPYSSIPVCLHEAGTSDALVLLVADKITPITRDEYRVALEAGVPCFIFLMSGVERQPEARDFISRERARGNITANFEDLSELQTNVIRALGAHAVRAGRNHNYRRRFRRRSSLTRSAETQPLDAAAVPVVYEEIAIPIGFGSGSFPSFEALADEAKRLVEAGHPRGALLLIGRSLEQASAAGLPNVVLRLVALLGRLVPEDSLELTDQAWMLHAEALAHNAIGHRSEAIAALDQMQEIGRQVGDQDIVATATQGLGAIAHESGEYEEARRLYREAFRIKLDIQDQRGVLQLVINLAAVEQDLGRLDESTDLLVRGEDLVGSLGDPHLLLSLYGNLGNLAVKRQALAEAEQHFRKALKFARRAADLMAEVQSLQNLGAVHLDQGKLSEGIRWYRRALGKAGITGAPPQLAVIHGGLAFALHRAGRNREALQHFERARDFSEQSGDGHARAVALANLGALSLTLGSLDRGLTELSEALELFRALGDDEWQGRVLYNLVETHYALGNLQSTIDTAEEALRALPLEKHLERVRVLQRAAEVCLQSRSTLRLAADFYQRALIEQRDAVRPKDHALATAQAGSALAVNGDDKAALAFFTSALEQYRHIDDRQMEFQVRNDLAISLTRLGRYDDARHEYEVCLSIAVELNDYANKCQALMNSGEMERSAGNLDAAISKHAQAANLAREFGDERAEAEVLANQGIALVHAERWEEAKQVFTSARRLARRTRSAGAEAMAVGGLGTVAFATNQLSDAVPFYLRAIEIEEAEGDQVHLLEDLAAVTEAFAALNDIEQAQVYGQRLVDLAQQYDATELASRALARVARWILKRGSLDDAASTYAAAILLSFGNTDEEQVIQQVTQLLLLMVFQVRMERSEGESEFYGAVLTQVNERIIAAGQEPVEFLGDWLKIAQEVADMQRGAEN